MPNCSRSRCGHLRCQLWTCQSTKPAGNGVTVGVATTWTTALNLAASMAGPTSQRAKVPLFGCARCLHTEQHQRCSGLHVNSIQRPPTAVLAEDSLGPAHSTHAAPTKVLCADIGPEYGPELRDLPHGTCSKAQIRIRILPFKIAIIQAIHLVVLQVCIMLARTTESHRDAFASATLDRGSSSINEVVDGEAAEDILGGSMTKD